MDADCLFCRIVAGESPARIVRKTDNVVAFRDVNPQAPTHILIVPKEHLRSMEQISEGHADVLVEMIQSAIQLARAEGVDRTGWRLVANTGADAGQSVHHLHFHLLGGRRMEWPPG
ncbi:MAG TPA: histidine triad nucleotide-binding protein [Actinomycetota bacterium]|nr:histidine triad nucleotide-binding protein [Actinomycetota bacterium]